MTYDEFTDVLVRQTLDLIGGVPWLIEKCEKFTPGDEKDFGIIFDMGLVALNKTPEAFGAEMAMMPSSAVRWRQRTAVPHPQIQLAVVRKIQRTLLEKSN